MSEGKKVSQYLKLKDNHPTMVKLAKLYDLAEELGINVSFGSMRSFVNDRDRDSKLPPLIIEDVDNGEAIGEWPPSFEYKVYYENPEYIAQQEAERKERDAKRKQEEDEREVQRKAKEKAEKEARERAIEQKERAELARLKAKYHD